MKTTEQLKDEKLEALINAATIMIKNEINDFVRVSDLRALKFALAMLTETPRCFKKDGLPNHRAFSSGICERQDLEGNWVATFDDYPEWFINDGWTEYFPDAEASNSFKAWKDFAKERAEKPYLPLPEPDLVVLGHGESFKVENPFNGWVFDLGREAPFWDSGLWRGNIPDVIYAAPRDSEVARLNWEKILNRELQELGKDKAPSIPEGFDRIIKRGKSWRPGRKATFCISLDRSKMWSRWINGQQPRGSKYHIYLEAVKDKPREEQEEPDIYDAVAEYRANHPESISPAPNIPTERQKMAATIFAGYMAAKVFSGNEAYEEAFKAADIFMARKDGE